MHVAGAQRPLQKAQLDKLAPVLTKDISREEHAPSFCRLVSSCLPYAESCRWCSPHGEEARPFTAESAVPCMHIQACTPRTIAAKIVRSSDRVLEPQGCCVSTEGAVEVR